MAQEGIALINRARCCGECAVSNKKPVVGTQIGEERLVADQAKPDRLLGHLYDKRGSHEKAFRYFKKANDWSYPRKVDTVNCSNCCS